MKRILSLFIAVIILCIALPVTASAEQFQWEPNDNRGLYGNNIVTVSNDSSGYITVYSGTTTITGNATLSGNLDVYVRLGAKVIWEANVTGPGTVTFTDRGTATITGSIISTGGTAVQTSAANLIVNGGTITGTKGIDCLDGTVTINSGTVTATGYDAAVDITMGSYDPVVTIGGTAVINGGLNAHGVRIGNTKASLLITNGTISGQSALYSGGFESLDITGGTFSPTGLYQGIYSSVTQAMTIAPTASTPVTVRGNVAIKYDQDAGSPTFSNVFYYYAGDNADGTGKVLYDNSRYGFTFPSTYKYVEFHAVNPEPPIETVPKQPDTSTPPHLVTHAPSIYPPAIPEVTPIYAPEEMNMDVTAILNKQGSVDSSKTRLEVLRAARTKGVTQITLILPEDCKGISAAAIKKCVRAGGSIPMLLAYDDVKIRLTENTRQVLTKLYYSGR